MVIRKIGEFDNSVRKSQHQGIKHAITELTVKKNEQETWIIA